MFNRAQFTLKLLACLLVCAGALFPASPSPSLLVKDLTTGTTLVSAEPDARHYPASLTKLMTLYLLFERIDVGEVRLDQKFTVSKNAALQPPTKVGLRPGVTMTAEECIGALIVKSANDAAVVVAEGIAGDEATFAEMMTRKARTLGMADTVFRNASGLPDAEQVTTSRDLSILATALVQTYPRYYPYFALRSCKVGRKTLFTHNNFLGAYEGAEGMKTGYTRDAGYNLVATAERGGHRLVGVILGSEGAGTRDWTMVQTMNTAFLALGVPPPAPKAAAKHAHSGRSSARPAVATAPAQRAQHHRRARAHHRRHSS